MRPVVLESFERRVLMAAVAPLYINAGGSAMLDALSRPFVADSGFSGGHVVQGEVFDDPNTTGNDASFSSYHAGNSFTFSAPVNNGRYALFLEFAEPDPSAVVGQRAFDVSAEGAAVLSDFDVVAAAGGAQRVVARSVDLTITDGALDLNFQASIGEAMVSAVALMPTDVPAEAAPYSWLAHSDSSRVVLAQSNLRDVGSAIFNYAISFKGALPPDLASSERYAALPVDVFANPRTSTLLARDVLSGAEKLAWVTARSDYIYLGAGKNMRNITPSSVLAYDNPDREYGDIGILWGDGHVGSLSRSDAAALLGFPDAPPSDPPPPNPSVAPPDPLVVQSQANLHAIRDAMQKFSNENKNRNAPTLGVLYRWGYITDIRTFIDPRGDTQPPPDNWTLNQKADWVDASSDYRYMAAGTTGSAVADSVAACENPDTAGGGHNVLFADGRVEFRETRFADETVAASAPRITNARYDVDANPGVVTLTFLPGLDPATLSDADITVKPDSGAGLPVIHATYAPASGGGGVVRVRFDPGTIGDGNWRLGMSAGAVTNVAGLGSAGFQWLFTILAGDANLDLTVDTLDFNALAANFGGTGKLNRDGDFNHDGAVDTLDFNILAGQFGKSVPYTPTFPFARTAAPSTQGAAPNVFSAKAIDEDGLALEVVDALDPPLA